MFIQVQIRMTTVQHALSINVAHEFKTIFK